MEAVDLPAEALPDISQDPREERRGGGVSGVLPSDFPPGLPVYRPSSVVDLGAADDGWYRVTFLASAGLGDVRGHLLEAARRSGWSVSGGGASYQLSRDGQRVRWRIEDASPGTRIQVDYPP